MIKFSFRLNLCPNFESGAPWNTDNFINLILLQTFKAFGLTAFNLLCLCYTPGKI